MKKFDRRKFLKLTCAGTCGGLAHNILSPVSRTLAFASPNAGLIGPQPVTVVVFLAGGCTYNWTPVYRASYRDRFPTLGRGPENSIVLDPNTQGLHPSLTGFKSEWDDGKLALVNMAGYPDPNLGHDESTRIIQTGARSLSTAGGGLGARVACQLSSAFPVISFAGPNTFVGGGCNNTLALGNLNGAGESEFLGGQRDRWFKETRTELMMDANPLGNPSAKHVKDSIDRFETSIDLIRQRTPQTLPATTVTFPAGEFGDSCRDAARLISARELGVGMIYLQLGGFDLHTNEFNGLTGLMNVLNQGVTALVQTVKALGRYPEFTLVTATEFGRGWQSGRSDASPGCEHGHCSSMLVLGGAVNGGIKSEIPDDSDMARPYLDRPRVDFRQVFEEIAVAMRLDAASIFAENYQRRPLGLF